MKDIFLDLRGGELNNNQIPLFPLSAATSL